VGERNATPARPIIYYEYHINIMFLVLYSLTFIFRILCSIILFLLSNGLNKMDKIIKSQLAENLIRNSDDLNEISSGGPSIVRSGDGINLINPSEESSKDSVDFMDKLSNSQQPTILIPNNESEDRQRTCSVNGKFSSDLYYKRILYKNESKIK
jgi:hypothetical protein